MSTILLVSDSDDMFEKIDSILASEDTKVLRISDGTHLIEVVSLHNPEVVILDMQIGNMGAVACSINLRQEEAMGRLDSRKIIILLDRKVDDFIAKESGADSWMLKPISDIELSRSVSVV